MNAQELRDFNAKRSPSRHAGDEALACHGCAHSDATAPPPGRPSGERPCCSCVRNPDREKWERGTAPRPEEIVYGDDGHARQFDPFTGAAYNGAPLVHFPMDNYVTLDRMDQERFYKQHPEYKRPVSFDAAGNLKVADDAEAS